LTLAITIAGIFVYVGFGRLEGEVLTQSVFPSLIALAGTALGFYFGAQSRSESPPADRGATQQQKPEAGGTDADTAPEP
jgi:hypothetical protein